ncbi:MAG: hypothetical protein WCW87_00705 [Candidatus Paceibacterota bacterium]
MDDLISNTNFSDLGDVEADLEEELDVKKGLGDDLDDSDPDDKDLDEIDAELDDEESW